ncbi:MAG: nucleotidyltransferase domain-containing protein [Candidatus Cloacimonetes bacterium]|nr:nucleotidyltransferase domain-containing protein [Candidatus Cloacimonadota bacterium]
MISREYYLDILQKFKQEYGAEYGIISIGLFGSLSRDEHIEGSDVDVLVEAPFMCMFTKMDIRERLESMFGVRVDVVRKTKYMNPRFKDRIEREVIYV